MSKILSQQEIDMLVSALSSGQLAEAPPATPGREVQEKVIKSYDFRAPEKLSREHLHLLNTISEDFSRFVSNALSAYLRTHLEVSIAKTDQLPYGELVYGEMEKAANKPKPGVIVLFSVSALGSGILQMDLPLVFSIIDRMMGGPGWAQTKVRELTSLEKEMTTEIFNKILHSFREVWLPVKEFTPRVTVLESDPRLIPRVVPFHEVMVRTIFGVKLGETFGLMKLAVPYLLLLPLLNKLLEEGGAHKVPVEKRGKEAVLTWLGRIRLPVTAELGAATISTKELLELKPGYVVTLDKDADGEVTVKVGTRAKFLGKLGTVGEARAVQLTSIVREEIEENA